VRLSYEREYYDLMRSAMLKYNFQVRIGKMNGVFIGYHNTAYASLWLAAVSLEIPNGNVVAHSSEQCWVSSTFLSRRWTTVSLVQGSLAVASHTLLRSLSLTQLQHCSALGDEAFEKSLYMFQVLLDYLLPLYPDTESLRLVVVANRNKSRLEIFVDISDPSGPLTDSVPRLFACTIQSTCLSLARLLPAHAHIHSLTHSRLLCLQAM